MKTEFTNWLATIHSSEKRVVVPTNLIVAVQCACIGRASYPGCDLGRPKPKGDYIIERHGAKFVHVECGSTVG